MSELPDSSILFIREVEDASKVRDKEVISKVEEIISVWVGVWELQQLCKKEPSTHGKLEQSLGALALLLQMGLATLENFPVLSNGVGVSFPLRALRCMICKLPQTLEQVLIPFFSYKILRKAGSQSFK